jgi:hypothetical protein
MPKPTSPQAAADSKRRELIGAGMLVAVLSSLWLFAEIGVIKTSIPVGPIVMMIAGFAMMVPNLRK